MSVDWPSRGDLRELQREAQEHKRAWGIISGLSQRLQDAEIEAEKRKHNVNNRQAELESRIRKQRVALARIEECRAWELGTERLLVQGLINILDTQWFGEDEVKDYAKALINQYEIRKGPRPENQGENE